jgi:hypothetical protein
MFTNHELSNEVDKEFKELLIKAQEFKNLTEQLEFLKIKKRVLDSLE